MPYGGSTPAFTGAPSTVLTLNNNALPTPVVGTATTFVVAVAGELTPPVAGYAAAFQGRNEGALTVEFTADTGEDFRVDVSGQLTHDNPGLDSFVVCRVTTDLQQEFTGGTKAYPLGITWGAGSSPQVGFEVVVYGKFTKGERLSLELSANAAGNVTVTDCLLFAVRIQPGVQAIA